MKDKLVTFLMVVTVVLWAITAFVREVRPYGGNVSGTPTGQSKSGTSNTVPKYNSNGQIANSLVTEDGTTLTAPENVNLGSGPLSTVISNGAQSIGTGVVPVAATLLIRSTSTVLANPILNVQRSDANAVFQVMQSSQVVLAGPLNLASRTIAQLQALAPALRDAYICSDCSPVKIVIATGTSAGNFADAVGGAFK